MQGVEQEGAGTVEGHRSVDCVTTSGTNRWYSAYRMNGTEWNDMGWNGIFSAGRDPH